MNRLVSYYVSSESDNDNNDEENSISCKEKTKENFFCQKNERYDFFNLDDSSNDSDLGDGVSCENISQLNKYERKRKTDGEKDIDLLMDSHNLVDSQYGPFLYKDLPVGNDKEFYSNLPVKKPCLKKNKHYSESCNSVIVKPAKALSVASCEEIDGSGKNEEISQSCVSGIYEQEIHPKIQRHLFNKIISKPPQRLLKKMFGHSGCVNQMDWCIPEYSHILLSASMDKTIKLWNVFSGTCVSTLISHSSAVKCAKWRSDGILILSGGYDNVSILSDAIKGKEISVFQHNHYVTSCIWHPGNSDLFLTGSLGQVQLWDKREKDMKPSKLYESNFGQVLDLKFLMRGEQFICSSDLVSKDSADRTIMAWDLRSTAILSNQIYHERYTCPSLCVHPSDHWFVAQSNGNYIAEFSTQRPFKMNRNKRFEGHEVSGYMIGCDFSHDGKILASGSANGELYLYDFYSGDIITSLVAFKNSPCMAVNFHPVLNSTVATSSWNGDLAIWH